MRSTGTAYIVVTVDGILVLDEKARIVKEIGLPEDAESRAQSLRSLEEGKPIPQLAEASKATMASVMVVENDEMARAVSRSGWKGAVRVEFPSLGGRMVRKHQARDSRRWPIRLEVAQLISSEKTRTSYQDWDRLVIQAVEAIDELDRGMANLYARCREWYAIHFPELERIVKNEKSYTEIIIHADPRSVDGILEDLDLSDERRRRIREAAQTSMGVQLGEEDLEAIRQLARAMRFLDERKAEILDYLSALMEKNAPSLTKVAEAGVGARLIARAGSMRKLALMPSTSVQTLGAEKALFRHITKGAKPPKHGIIFQHPHVRNSPKGIRGKVASILASKISLAARTDFITGNDKGEDLRSSLDASVRQLRQEAS